MTTPSFGKKGTQKPSASNEQKTVSPSQDVQPTMDDFWSDEAHRPDPASATIESAMAGSAANVTAADVENQIPKAETLIKPYENKGTDTGTVQNTTTQNISAQAPTPAAATAATAPVVATATTAATPPEASDENSVREIGSATFRRLDEPVEMPATEQAEQAEPIIMDAPAPASAVSSPVVEETTEVLSPAPIQMDSTPNIAAESPAVETPTFNPVMEAEITPPHLEAATPTLSPHLENISAAAVEPIVEPVIEPVIEQVMEPIAQPLVEEIPEPVITPAAQNEFVETPIEDTTQVLAEVSNVGENLGVLEPEDEAISADVYDALGNEEHITAPVETLKEEMPEIAAGELAGIGANKSISAADLLANEALANLIAEHEQWLDSAGAEGKRAVFKDNLSGKDFSHKRLSGASFRGLDLSRCVFKQTYLNEVDFGECQLDGADFSTANLDNAILVNASAQDASFSAVEMNEADLEGAKLARSNFMHAKVKGTNFRDADLTEVKFDNVTANLANFRDAKLHDATMNHGDFSQAIFRDATLHRANLEGANLVQANFKDALLEQADLSKTDFSQALDIAAETQAHFMQIERDTLKEELRKLEAIRDELEKRERKLISDREDMQRQIQSAKTQSLHNATGQAHMLEEKTVAKLTKASRMFLVFGVGWFLLCFLLGIVLQNVISQLDSNDLSLMEMLLMGIIMLVPLFFFVMSMAKSFSISYALRKLTPQNPSAPE